MMKLNQIITGRYRYCLILTEFLEKLIKKKIIKVFINWKKTYFIALNTDSVNNAQPSTAIIDIDGMFG